MLVRRDFLAWFCRVTGGGLAMTVAPGGSHMTRINCTLMSEARAAEPCTEDYCTLQDNCGTSDTVGHTCEVRDACRADASGNCSGNDTCKADNSADCTTTDSCPSDSSGRCSDDVCTEDVSGTCSGDRCEADSSGDCTGDRCTADSSGACNRDKCTADSSGACTTYDTCTEDASQVCTTSDHCVSDRSGECGTDQCSSDSSASCTTDRCTADSSGGCSQDQCTSDSSGACSQDTCTADSSGDCTTLDTCTSDSSGACGTWDSCTSDSSQECTRDRCTSDSSGVGIDDKCISDSSGECTSDFCVSDSSGACVSDRCTSDSSGACTTRDVCTSDSSGECSDDNCKQDASDTCVVDRCGSDYSGPCTVMDVCVLDLSGPCESDLCREDRSSACTGSDTCTLDIDLSAKATRREFARAGFTKALKWLYRMAVLVLFCGVGLGPGLSEARTVVDCDNAIFLPEPTIATRAVSVSNPAGPFLGEVNGVLRADTDGNGLTEADPEIKDYDGDGNRELPAGTVFEGNLEYTVFYVPPDVVLVSTGPFNIKAKYDARIFGALRLAGAIEVAAEGVVDVRASAWMCEAEDAAITLVTALEGETSRGMRVFPDDGPVPTMPPLIDSDNDGVRDLVEGTGDSDGDGIPDYLDADTVRLKPGEEKVRITLTLPGENTQHLAFKNVAYVADTDESLDQTTRPAGRTFPHGLIRMDIEGLTAGQSLTIRLTYPDSIPENAEYWSYSALQGWVALPFERLPLERAIRVTFTDGGAGDGDGEANGVITDVSDLAIP